MKVKYKGYEIEVRREPCLGGWPVTYFDVFRISDGLIVIGDFTEGEDTMNDITDMMKDRVNEFIKTKGASENMAEDY